jgi:[acyl-carrier-protein] S-malonyltransferase
MGRSAFSSGPGSKVLERAQALLGMDLRRLCLEGPAEELSRTSIAQPCLLVVEVALWETLRSQGFRATCLAGHSLGEFAAWVAAGALEFEAALRLVAKRGQLMERAALRSKGAMAALLGLDEHEVEAVCEGAREGQVLVAANFNAPGQVVVSGQEIAVERAEAEARRRGARAVRLAVQGAFHSPLMEEAAGEFAREVENARIEPASVPVAANSEGRFVTEPDEIRAAMIRQMLSAVRWADCVRCLSDCDVLVEIGPGSVLAGLCKRILPGAVCVSAEAEDVLEQLYSISKGGAAS